jgi:hypothetical protein
LESNKTSNFFIKCILVIKLIKSGNGKKGNIKESTLGKINNILKTHVRVFTYIYSYFSNTLFPFLHILLEFHFVIYCIIFLIPLNFFYLFIPILSCTIFYLASQVTTFCNLEICCCYICFCYYFLLFVAFYTLYNFYHFVQFFSVPLLYEMLLHLTFIKKTCQFLLLPSCSFIDTYMYMCMYVYIPHFQIPHF